MDRLDVMKVMLAAETVEEVCALIDSVPLQPGRTLAQSMLARAEAKEAFRGTVEEYEEQGLVGPAAVQAAARAVWSESITQDGQHR